MDDPIRKLFRLATGQQDGKLFNRAADGHLFWDDYNARQGLTGFQPLVRILGHSVDVVCENNAIMSGSPIQYRWIVLLKNFRLLYQQIVRLQESAASAPSVFGA